MSEQQISREAEVEILAVLAEECGEVVRVIGKCIRHGMDSKNPMVAESPTNFDDLLQEMSDACGAFSLIMGLMVNKGSSMAEIQNVFLDGVDAKIDRVIKWSHHEEDMKILAKIFRNQ